MTPFQQGYAAAELNALTTTDTLNPYYPGTIEHTLWEQGFTHWVDEQFKQLQQEEEEKNRQLPLDF